MGLLSGRYGQAKDLTRAFRWQARHDDWLIRSVNGGTTFVAEHTGDHEAHVIAMHSLGKLMDRLESEYA